MASEDMIRELIGQGRGVISAPAGQMDEAMKLSEQVGKKSVACAYRNLRGECANPNLIGKYGMMSWDEYDAIEAAGKDPGAVSHQNLNPAGRGLNNPRSRG